MSDYSNLGRLRERWAEQRLAIFQEQIDSGSLSIRRATKKQMREWAKRREQIKLDPSLVASHPTELYGVEP